MSSTFFNLFRVHYKTETETAARYIVFQIDGLSSEAEAAQITATDLGVDPDTIHGATHIFTVSSRTELNKLLAKMGLRCYHFFMQVTKEGHKTNATTIEDVVALTATEARNAAIAMTLEEFPGWDVTVLLMSQDRKEFKVSREGLLRMIFKTSTDIQDLYGDMPDEPTLY